RKTLEEYLVSGRVVPLSPKNKILLEPFGAFVTLHKKDELRGCIGQFEPQKPLFQVIQEMAIAAATQDFRFSPVTATELGEITIEISVMTPKRKIDDWRKIKLGLYGVVVEKNGHAGTFLPQVATETGWNLAEFLSQLCEQKAGLSPEAYKDPTTKLFVFEAQIFAEKEKNLL
ncbi:MAG: AmmeMemoRadiSam system protein A, partial [bacterium]|nr:AmmeMemoRadiSam system protein A [bacterium]